MNWYLIIQYFILAAFIPTTYRLIKCPNHISSEQYKTWKLDDQWLYWLSVDPYCVWTSNSVIGKIKLKSHPIIIQTTNLIIAIKQLANHNIYPCFGYFGHPCLTILCPDGLILYVILNRNCIRQYFELAAFMWQTNHSSDIPNHIRDH